MNNLIKPYDLGDFQLTEYAQRVSINDLVRQAQKELKTRLLEAQIKALGIVVGLTASKTRFNGQRIWFLCPQCGQRKGTLYKHQLLENIGCRTCLGLGYKKQRYKNMIEGG